MSKTQAIKIYRVFGKTDKGLVREENQDAYAYFESLNGAVFALCDGMGGIEGGKQAAESALKEIEKFVSEDWYEDEKQLLSETFNFVNQKIRKKLGKPEINMFPGTTLLLALIRHNKVFYAHAGDSRIYFRTGKKLFRLTEDHSLVARLLKEKKISKEEAENHPQKNVIYNAIGIKEDVYTEICKKPIIPADNDILLLCSDGLTNELSDKEINDIFCKQKEIKETGNLLIKKALKKGGKDNVTVQIIQFYNTGKKTGTYKPPSADKRKKRLIRTAIAGFIFLLVNAWFMFNYFFGKKHIANENTENYHSVSKDLIFRKSRETVYYSAGSNIFSYPEIDNNTIIDILKLNNKKEFYFYPAEKIKTKQEK